MIIKHFKNDDQTFQNDIQKLKNDDQKWWSNTLIPASHTWDQHAGFMVESSMLVGLNHETSMLVSSMRPACWSQPWDQHAGLNPETSMLVSTLRPTCWSQAWNQHAGLKPGRRLYMRRNGIAKIYLIILSSGQWRMTRVCNLEWAWGVTENMEVVDGTYKELMSVSVIRHVLALNSSREGRWWSHGIGPGELGMGCVRTLSRLNSSRTGIRVQRLVCRLSGVSGPSPAGDGCCCCCCGCCCCWILILS